MAVHHQAIIPAAPPDVLGAVVVQEFRWAKWNDPGYRVEIMSDASAACSFTTRCGSPSLTALDPIHERSQLQRYERKLA